jgi:hypothetical protein
VRGTDGELRDLDRQIERASARMKNVTGAMAAAEFSEALLAQLKIEAQAVAALKACRATAAKDTRPKVLPHPRVIQTYLAFGTPWIATRRAPATSWPGTCRRSF